MTDVLEKSITSPLEVHSPVREAMRCLMSLDVEDGLSKEEKVAMVNKFVQDPSIANAYIALSLADNGHSVRVDWVRSMLKGIGAHNVAM